MSAHRVVVIGGGLAGTMVAVHLRRDFPAIQTLVTVVERRPGLGAGLAYGTADPACRTNVAASRMSPFEEAPLAFDDWLASGGADPADAACLAAGGRFPARAIYGRYLASLVDGTGIVHRRATAVSAQRSQVGFTVGLDDGRSLQAETLVLAVGHAPAALPATLRPLAYDPRVLRDPWDEAALARIAASPDGSVVIVGTGLTACDVLASLRRRGHRGPIKAVSRRGLMPRPRTTLPVSPYGSFDGAPSRTASALSRRVRATIAAARAAGRPWEDVIAALREQAPVVWRALPTAEQRRLLRHLRVFWDVHRYQCAPQIADLVARDGEAGRFEVHAASLAMAWADEDGVVLTCRERGSGATLRLRSDFVVNCTGPGHTGLVGSSNVLGDLHARGLIRPDVLGLGIDTSVSNLAVSADGVAVDGLFVAGPPARCAHGELMGLPQVSRQPRDVARSVAARIRDDARASEPIARMRTIR